MIVDPWLMVIIIATVVLEPGVYPVSGNGMSEARLREFKRTVNKAHQLARECKRAV